MSLIQDGPIQTKQNFDHENQHSLKSIELDEQGFMHLVGQISMNMPVVVVFHKQASPAAQKMRVDLEKIIQSSKADIQLGSLDIDTYPMLASQLQIQAVPTVMAFFQGRPLDGFAGPKDENQIRQFLSQISGQELMDPEKALEEALAMAKQALDEGQAEEAMVVIQQILSQMPESTKAIALLLRAQAEIHNAEIALTLVDQLDEAQKKDEHIMAAIKRLELLKNKKPLAEIQLIQKSYEMDPENLDSCFAYIAVLLTEENYEKAIELLLKAFQQDRSYNDEFAKTKLLEIFHMLGSSDERVIKGRQKFASLLW